MTAVAHDVAAGHHDSPEVVGRRQRMGVILLILADVAFVLSLVFTYLYLRQLDTEAGWIPKDSHTESTSVGWLIAIVMIAAWVVYRWGEVAARTGGQSKLVLGAGGAVVIAAIDLVLQLNQMVTSTLRAADGSYASSFMALAGYHAFHVILSIFIGLGLWNRARLGLFTVNNWQVRIVGYWWAWVAISAVITAATTSVTTITHAVS